MTGLLIGNARPMGGAVTDILIREGRIVARNGTALREAS